MPLYEFVCLDCGRRQDEIVTSLAMAPASLVCPCGEVMERQFPCPSFQFRQFTGEPPPVMKGASNEDIWGDNPIGQHTDGVNPLTYKSDKPFIDMGVG